MDAKEFEREDRYAVIKYKKLTDQQWTLVPTMLQNFEGSRIECVVVESDWPEYNFVWLMLEHRMAGFPVPDFNAVKCAADVAIAEQRLAAAEQRNATLETALKFYADGDHLLLADPDEWDTCSGEPINWLHDAAGTASVEDGSVAKQALTKPTEPGASE